MPADIAVLRQKIHGLSPADYAAAIRKRLPEHDVVCARTPAEEQSLLEEVEVATGFSIDDATVETASNLELFACVFAGTGHLPLDTLDEHGVAVTNASGVHGPNIAEHVIGAFLSFTRRFQQGWKQQQQRVWQSYQTRELKDSTVTVVGMGAIGAAILERLDPFGVETIGVRYTPEKGGPADEVVGLDDQEGIDDALARSEYVAIAAPLTEQTRGFLDEDAFLTMPTNTIVVNVGRGPIVETDALLDALQSNAIGGAALDVVEPEPLPSDHELWSFDNVLLTPHNGGHTPEYWNRRAEILADNVAQAEETGAFENLNNQSN